MNLETVEQRCLGYLKQVSAVAVPVERLLRHVRHDEACRDIEQRELVSFLSRHELFRVVNPLADTLGAEAAAQLNAMGIPTGARVMLSTRTPTTADLAGMMREQIVVLKESLNAAIVEAREEEDPERARELIAVASRADDIDRKLAEIKPDS